LGRESRRQEEELLVIVVIATRTKTGGEVLAILTTLASFICPICHEKEVIL